MLLRALAASRCFWISGSCNCCRRYVVSSPAFTMPEQAAPVRTTTLTSAAMRVWARNTLAMTITQSTTSDDAQTARAGDAWESRQRRRFGQEVQIVADVAGLESIELNQSRFGERNRIEFRGIRSGADTRVRNRS